VRPSRLRAVSAAVLPFVFLAACSSAKTGTPANALDEITVGGTNTAPTVTFKTKPLSVKVTTTKVVTAGKGAKLTRDNAVLFNYAIFNGKDGKQVLSNFGKAAEGVDLSSDSLLPGLIKGLTGQSIGSRLLVAMTPADAFGDQGDSKLGLGPKDPVIFFLSLVSASTPPKTAIGAAVPPKAGLPTVVVDGTKAAQITVPKTAAPTSLIIQPLIKGAGAVVKTGQTIKVNYTGVLWKNGKKFDASGDRGKPSEFQIGQVGTNPNPNQVIAGWVKGLVGQPVGSRMLLVVPPADGYGAKGYPPLIGPKDTLVFVVDILAAI
jgi:peptidylprolyl isomerase